MINYELARELRDANFPKDWSLWDDHDQDLLQKDWRMYAVVYCPDLLELIEACGDKFYILQLGSSLMGDRKIWYVYENEMSGMLGDTPDEAVARLWLSLNFKNLC